MENNPILKKLDLVCRETAKLVAYFECIKELKWDMRKNKFIALNFISHALLRYKALNLIKYFDSNKQSLNLRKLINQTIKDKSILRQNINNWSYIHPDCSTYFEERFNKLLLLKAKINSDYSELIELTKDIRNKYIAHTEIDAPDFFKGKTVNEYLEFAYDILEASSLITYLHTGSCPIYTQYIHLNKKEMAALCKAINN